MFKESKYPIKKFAFWFLIFATIISVFKIFFIVRDYANIPVFGGVVQPVQITIELDKKINKNPFLICFDDNCLTPETDDFYNCYHVKYGFNSYMHIDKPFNKIHFAYPKEKLDYGKNLKNIYINIGTKDYYIDKEDIKELNKKEVSLEFNDDGKKETYKAIELLKIGNKTPFITQVAIFLTSFSFSWQTYIFSYIFLSLAFLIYIFNKEKINLKINYTNKMHFAILGLIILLGAFLRIVDINNYPLWTDEVYTSVVALKSFSTCFIDPGNPPFFFVIEYLFSKIYGNTALTLRILPCVFGILLIPAIYLLFKRNGKNIALFAAFFASINLIAIYHSQEARAYSLDMLLVVVLIYTLFGYLNKPTIKRLVVYSIFATIAINTNYYLAIFVFANFIWAIVDLLDNKNKKSILGLFIAHFLAYLSFVPYLVVSLKSALAQGFNSWIPPLSEDLFYYAMNEYFGNGFIFTILCLFVIVNIVFCFLPKRILSRTNIKIDKNKENLFIYLIYSIVLIIIIASLISIFVKPIFHKRVLLSIYSLLMVLEYSLMFSVIKFEKITKLASCVSYFYVLTILLISFTITEPMPCKRDYNLQHFFNFVSKDIKKYQDKYEIHIINADTFDYINYYPELVNNKNIIWHFFSTNSGEVLDNIEKLEYSRGKQKMIIYFNSIGIRINNIVKSNPNATLYTDNLTSFARLKYE